MVYTKRMARKDRTDNMGNLIKKGEEYLDKGFGQIEKLHKEVKPNSSQP